MISLKAKNLRLWHLLLFFGCLYLMLAIRLPIWVDEAFTIQQSSLDLELLIRDCLTRQDAVHLVYYLICWFVGAFFDNNLLALRLLSVIATVGSLKNVFGIVITKYGKNTALLAVAIFALLPVTFDFATQARSTALVTYLFSLSLLIALRNDASISIKKLIQIVVLSCLFVSFNFLSLLGYLIIAISLVASNLEYFRRAKPRILLLTPFIVSLPFILLGQRQKVQIQWIGSESSLSEMFARSWLWPVLGDDRYSAKTIIALLILSLIFALELCKKEIRLIPQDHLERTIVGVAVLPPLGMLIVSIVQPLFIVRYFEYSTLGIAILIALILSQLKSIVVRGGFFLVFIVISIANITNFSQHRDGKVDWDRVSDSISEGVVDTPIVLNPSWSTPLARYYLTNAQDKTIIGGFPNLESLAQLSCSNLPRQIWLISSFQELTPEDYRRMKLLGYESKLLKKNIGQDLFFLKNCPNYDS